MSDSKKRDRSGETEPCHDWPLDRCSRGEKCWREHHPNLDTALYGTQGHEFVISNDVGAACMDCLDSARQCDKLGRGGNDDPCSECRWFGGEDCICTLAQNTSYNDVLFRQMLVRSDDGYSLAPAKDPEALRGKKNKIPTQMPADQIKPDWTGETKEQLLYKPNMLPSYVRELPRAHLIPPRPSGKQIKSQNYKCLKHESSATLSFPFVQAALLADPVLSAHAKMFPQQPAPALPYGLLSSSLPLPPPAFARPARSPQYGEVRTISWSWITNRWTLFYENGTSIMEPPWPSTHEHGYR